MSQLARAVSIAAQAHEHQKDKGGAPYVLHPLRMMFQMQTDAEKTVAVLHDVLEDAEGWTVERLREEGFSEEVVGALDCVTKRNGEDYGAFIERAASNPVALKVKLADMKDNMDLTRLGALTEKDVARLQKYHRFYNELQAR
jgi:(p)ppGpp synthase/HD superfamily hydrolase